MSLEDPSQPLLPPSALYETLGMGLSDSGVMVNERQAMRITTAQVCIRIISEDLASTGHEIFQRMPDASMRLATNHRLWPMLHDRPNENMSAKVYWGATLACALAYGNGYSWIKRDGAARATALIPLASEKTSPVKIRGKLLYATTQTDTGAVAYIEPDHILHFMGLTLDGIVGLSPIQSCKNAFGLASAAEKFGAQFFAHGARATGVLSYPGQLDAEAQANLEKSAREMASGHNALAPIILEEGMKWTQITVNPNDAQFLATRQFQKDEIAGLYRVPLHLVGSLLRATNNNIEHQSLDYIRYCLRPWAVGMEQEINHKLLGGPFTMEHNLNDMQRGDFASQTAGFQTLRNIGVYSADDILIAMRQNPIGKAAGGDIRTVQGAMIPLTSLLSFEDGAEPTTDSGEGASQPFDRIAPAYRKLMRDAVGRVMNRGSDGSFARKAFQPVVSSMAQTMLALRFGNCDLTRRELALIEAQTSAIAESAGAWEKKDASAIATRVTEQVYGALAGEILS